MMQQLDPLGTSVTTAARSTPATKGYGIRAAVWAGANLDKESAPMLFDRGIVAPGVDAVDGKEIAFGGKAFPGTVSQYNTGTQPFLKVNRNGERFANESCPYNDIVHAASHQPGASMRRSTTQTLKPSLATVERYNELYDKQNDEDFGKPAYRLSAIRTAPFYGCWLGASLLTTEQGIAINEKGQALDTNNQPWQACTSPVICPAVSLPTTIPA